MKNIDIYIDIEMASPENIDIDKDILENINIDKGILQNIDIDKGSYRLEFGISNTPNPKPSHKIFESMIGWYWIRWNDCQTK